MNNQEADDELLIGRTHPSSDDESELELDEEDLLELEDDLADEGDLDLEPDDERGE